MSRTEPQKSLISEASVWKKLSLASTEVTALLNGQKYLIPDLPARDIKVLPPEQHPDKPGLSTKDGQARLLHDLASIELQAFELAYRTLAEFPDAESEFREELAKLLLSESEHLRLCLEAIDDLGFQWGSFPVHNLLWKATSANDSLLDRIFIVHRYFEGSGLDAGETLLRRLQSVHLESKLPMVANQIIKEEIDHVQFGSKWYRYFCEKENLQSDKDFVQRFTNLRHRLPKRIEKISYNYRKQAGFTDSELSFLTTERDRIVKFPHNGLKT